MKNSYRLESMLVKIDRFTADGYGAGRSDQHKLVVFNALPGETAKVTPITRRRGVLFGRADEIIDPSEHRVEPFCEFSDRCAGCAMQHLGSARQLAFKQEQLRNHLGGITPGEWLSPLQGPTRGYRSKARLGVKYVTGKGRVLVGFREKLSNYVAEVDHCGVLVESVGTRLALVSEVVNQMTTRKAIPQIEVAAGDHEAALVFRHLDALPESDIALLLELGRAASLQIYLQPKGPETAHRIFPEAGPELLHFAIPDFNIEMGFHPLDFTQVNLAANRLMVSRAVELLELDAADRVLDLFCGIGNFSLPMARRAGRVDGIEGSARSVDRAKDNAERNGVGNVSFSCADLYLPDALTQLLKEDWNKIVIDPPRSGAQQVCEALTQSSAASILYLSCNPVTLARDSGVLVAAGFSLEKAGVVDMFPHTSHVESMALFRR